MRQSLFMRLGGAITPVIRWFVTVASMSTLCVACSGFPAAPSATGSGSVPGRSVSAIPEHVISGVIRDDAGEVISGAAISILDGTETVRSGPNGDFSIRATADRTRFKVERDGYESREFGIVVTPEDVTVTVVLQRAYTVSVTAAALGVTLEPGDAAHYVGEPYESEYCSPCKVIHLRTSRRSSMRVTLRWSDPAPLGLWVEGGVKAPAFAPGAVAVQLNPVKDDTLVYVGLPLEGGRRQSLDHPTKFVLTLSEE